jgi:hypothetical protein
MGNLTGRYSRDLPPRLLEWFEAALDDRELLSHRRDASLIQAMIGQRLAEMKESQINPTWTTSRIWSRGSRTPGRHGIGPRWTGNSGS